MNEVEVFVEVCREGVELPEYKNLGDAGMDVRAAENVVIDYGQTVVIPTGLKMAIPQGYEVQVRPRSGLSLKTKLRIPNSPGTLDAEYKDEIGIIVENTSVQNTECIDYTGINERNSTNAMYSIKKGDRIAQLVLKEVPVMKLTKVDSVANIGGNRGGGFGSTGVK